MVDLTQFAAPQRRATYNFAAALEAARALLKKRRIASARVIFPRFAHRSRALIVSTEAAQ